MLPLGMIVGFLGYTAGTWGYILVKGYNITLRSWVSPLHPYQGTLTANGCVPIGNIFPVPGPGGPCSNAASLVPALGGGVAPSNPSGPLPPTNGKCPPGYTLSGGTCFPNAQAQPAPM